MFFGETRQGLFAVSCLQDPEPLALERVREQLPDGFLVVNEENGRGVGHVGSAVGCLPSSWCQGRRDLL